ncbi:zinc finger protein 32-like isoform X2 [Esox lucius]|uniref:C2H2-type domain-containing protein n=1 Tax=Esox lucius TaxID=8010 RepID=A0A3P8Y3T1_ESOLU|nr:zinc finger protein 32-like isoform X2 [Esox lucius]XP_034146432.1 zinc finger protein 32-like isoform X2 [Esox lucius]
MKKTIRKRYCEQIFGAVEKTVLEYQEENDRLRRMLRVTPELQLCRIDSLQFSLAVSDEEVPPEQQHCEQEWRTNQGQEESEPTRIKEEQDELGIDQEEEQCQGLFDTKDSIFTPPCVKSKCDQGNQIWSSTPPRTQSVENRENYSEPVDLTPFDTMNHLNGFDIPCDLPDDEDIASIHSSAFSSDPVELDSSSQLDPISPLAPSTPLELNQPMDKPCSKPSSTSQTVNHCHDCGKTFALKADLQRHVTFARKRLSECRFCKRCYDSSCKLKTHIHLCHNGKPCTCPFCGKTFKQKGNLSRHMSIHTGEKPFSCLDCGKSFTRKEHLTKHRQTHTGEKPFSCSECGKLFNRKEHLNKHIHIHKGEKPFSCGSCGKRFNRKGNLNLHIRTHTGERQHGCLACGKRFTQKTHLLKHVDNIHIERKTEKRKKMFGQKMEVKRRGMDHTHRKGKQLHVLHTVSLR